VVLVDLDEGIRLVSNLTDCPTDDVRIGMPVEVHFVPVGDDAVTIPAFRPSAFRPVAGNAGVGA